MSKRKKTPTPPAEDLEPPLAAKIHAEREKLFLVLGIVDCCIYASDSMIEEKAGRPDLRSALEAAHKLIDCTASKLGEFCDQLEKTPRATQG